LRYIGSKFDMDLMYKLMMQNMDDVYENINDYLPEDGSDLGDFIPDNASQGRENFDIKKNRKTPTVQNPKIFKKNQGKKSLV